jgi:hypothetical protein
MWNDDDFQSAIDCICMAIYKEEIEDFNGLLKRICIGEDKIKLWGMLTEMQREILKHPEYLPSIVEEEYRVAA